MESKRKAEVAAARKELTTYALSCEKHGLKPDPRKMEALHERATTLQETVQPLQDAVGWLCSNGYTEPLLADRIVLGLEQARFPPSQWLHEVSTQAKEHLLAFGNRFDVKLNAKGDLSLSDHERGIQATSGASSKAAIEREAQRQRQAVGGGLHVAGQDTRWAEWKKAEARAAQAKEQQRRAQAEHDAKFRAGMMLKLKRGKAQKKLADFQNLQDGSTCDAQDRYAVSHADGVELSHSIYLPLQLWSLA